MPKTVETPDVLTGHAKEIWDAAFLSAYDGTCKEEAEGSGRDGCSAAVAWAAVKEQYKKNEDGEWVEKAADPTMGPVSDMPSDAMATVMGNPTSGDMDGEPRMKRWRMAFAEALQGECRNTDRPVECARSVANEKVGRGRVGMSEDMSEKSFTPEYVQRRQARHLANTYDLATIQTRGDEQVRRPDHIPSGVWRSLPLAQRSVRAQALRRITERNYAQAVEDAKEDGWGISINPTHQDEVILHRTFQTNDGSVIVRAILVRNRHETEWKLHAIQTGMGGSLAVRLAPDQIRHRREF